MAHSAIWSSLFTLESVEQIVDSSPPLSHHYKVIESIIEKSTSSETSMEAQTRRDRFVKTMTKRRAHQVLVSAVALIGASSPDSKTVTACAMEVFPPVTPNGFYDIVFRIAQNQTNPVRVQDEVSKLQVIVNQLVQEVQAQPPHYWNDKKQREEGVWKITRDTLIPLVVERCYEKLKVILSAPYSTPFVEWHNANVSEDNPFPEIAGLEPNLRRKIRGMFRSIINSIASCKNKNRMDEIVTALFAAYEITTDHLEIFEKQWDTHSDKLDLKPVLDSNEEDLDDAQSLEEPEYRKNHIHRFLNKLARYVIASRTIIRALANIHCSETKFTITISNVPFNDHDADERHPFCCPVDENEYPTFANFMETELHMDLKNFESKKVGIVRDRWAHAHRNDILVVHAELQLALYYSLYPEVHPIQGFIGVSKLCCFACDFVIKHLQMPSYGDDDIDPINFVVDGTHGQRYSHWLFPHPSMIRANESELNDPEWNKRAKKVAKRFDIIRKDLQETLVDKVKRASHKLKKADKLSDSSGMEDVGGGRGRGRSELGLGIIYDYPPDF